MFQRSYTPSLGGRPTKSILKKTNSFTLKGFTPLLSSSPGSTPYTTVTGAESRIRLAFEAIFRKSAQLQDVDRNGEHNSENASVLGDEALGSKPQILPMSPPGFKRVQLVRVCRYFYRK